MKNVILLIGLILGTISLSAQDSKSVSYGLEIHPKITSQIFDNSELGESFDLLSASIAGNVYLNIGARHQLKTGLNLSMVNIEQLDYSLTFPCDIVIEPKPEILPKNSWVKTEHKIFYLGIPIEDRIKLSVAESHPYLSVGGEVLFNIGKSGKSYVHECESPEGVETDWADPNPVLILASVGLGYEFALNSGGSCFFEPKLQYSLTEIFDSSKFPRDEFNNSRTLNIGFAAGIRFKCKDCQ